MIELGCKWPCKTEGMAINLDEAEPHAGDVLECYFECDKDIIPQEAIKVVANTVLIKENYPGSVIHYINIEPRRITIQYSVAPPGGHASPVNWYAIYWIIALIIIGVVVITAVKRGYIYPVKLPTGALSVSAAGCDDEQCTSPEALDVTFSVSGETYRTTGGTVLIKDLPVGSYDIIPGLPPEGYQPAEPITVSINKDQTTQIRLKYYEVGVTPPEFAWLVIDTSPVKGPVYVDEEEIGEAPVEVKVSPLITYIVSFGDVAGYDTPPSQSLSLQRGEKRAVNGIYEKVGWPEWAKWLAIGGGITAGALVVGKTVELLVRRRA